VVRWRLWVPYARGMQPGHVATVGLDGEPAEALRERFDRILEEPGARVVLLVHGAGPAAARAPDCTWLERYPLPTVFCFDGTVSGQALALAAACDIRVCGAGASIVYEPTSLAAGTRERLGLLLGGARRRLPAKERQWTAARALRAGLVSSVVPGGTALAEGERVAAVIAWRGPIAVRLAKEAIWRGLEMPLSQGLRFETDLTLLLQTTKDRAEGVAAFLEKRRPQFTGE
jgi:enoyl-CoA hydratase/carnithine racemase